MGYTHYWQDGEVELTKEVVEDVKKILAAAEAEGIAITGDPRGERPARPVADDGKIVFNGLGEDGSYETFAFVGAGEGVESAFNFCKTARRPYDAVASAVLLRLGEEPGGGCICSDGTFFSDWQSGRELFEKALGRDARCPEGVGLGKVCVRVNERSSIYVSTWPNNTAQIFSYANKKAIASLKATFRSSNGPGTDRNIAVIPARLVRPALARVGCDVRDEGLMALLRKTAEYMYKTELRWAASFVPMNSPGALEDPDLYSEETLAGEHAALEGVTDILVARRSSVDPMGAELTSADYIVLDPDGLEDGVIPEQALGDFKNGVQAGFMEARSDFCLLSIGQGYEMAGGGSYNKLNLLELRVLTYPGRWELEKATDEFGDVADEGAMAKKLFESNEYSVDSSELAQAAKAAIDEVARKRGGAHQ